MRYVLPIFLTSRQLWFEPVPARFLYLTYALRFAHFPDKPSGFALLGEPVPRSLFRPNLRQNA